MYSSKNKSNTNNNLNNNIKEKIVINSITDLLKIPIHKLNNSNLENISGEYFDKIYQEAINSENKIEKEESLSSSNNIINKKIKKKNIKEKKIKNNANLIPNNKRKKKVIGNKISNNNNFGQKDFYVEEQEIGIPEAEGKYPKYNPNSQKNIKTNSKKSEKIKLQKENNKINNPKINKVTPINPHQNYNINNITPNNNQIDIMGQEETPGNEENENNFYISTPTPMPPEDNEKIENLVVFPLNKMIFSINYNTFYGEEVCILGSSPKLGIWKLSGALHLKWNKGNVWKGEINIEVDDLQDFEFKFVIVEKGKIKYWESGDNNIVNFTGLINAFQNYKKGKYSKYEYEYNPLEGCLLLKCHWNK